MKRNLLFITISLGAFLTTLAAQAQNLIYDWAIQHYNNGSPARGQVTSAKITTDSKGNIYTFGLIADTIYFGGQSPAHTEITAQTGSGASQWELYVSKMDADSNLLWVKKLDKKTYNINHAYYAAIAAGIVADEEGGVYLAGSFPGAIDADPGAGTTLLAAPDSTLVIARDAVILKLDSIGALQWSRHLTKSVASWMGTAFRRATDIRMSDLVRAKDGSLYASGLFFSALGGDTVFADPGGLNYQLTFPGMPERSVGFWLKMDPANGTFDTVYTVKTDTSGSLFNFGVYPDPFGGVYTWGSFTETFNFELGSGPGVYRKTPATGSLRYNAFVARYDDQHRFHWVNTWPSSRSYATAFALDPSGNPALAARFLDSIRITDRNGDVDTFLVSFESSAMAKYDTAGNALWAQKVNLNTAEDRTLSVNGIASDAFGNIYAAGTANGRFNFSGITYQTYDHGFIQKINTTGSQEWLMRFGTSPFLASQQLNNYAVHIDSANNLYTAGLLRRYAADLSPLDTATHMMTPAGSYNNFVAKYLCKDTASSVHQVASCGPYLFNGETYTASGVYRKRYWSAGGCDSIVTLELTVNTIDEPFITVNNFELGVTSNYDTYQWLLNNVPITGATGSTYQVGTNGDYTVVVGLANGCTDTSEVYTVSNVTSIDELDRIGRATSIFPNPAKDLLHIKAPVAVQVTVSSVEGRLLRSAVSTTTLSLKDLDAGIYLISISDKEGRLIKVEKIAKQ